MKFFCPRLEIDSYHHKIYWTCSDYAHHSHRYRWTAWACGRVQWFFHKLK